MRPPVAYVAPRELTSPQFCRAFAQGCHGEVCYSGSLRSGPVALFGSPQLWPLLKQAQRFGREWWYGDHGYFGRGVYYRITQNAYQHDGRGQSTGLRFRRFRRPIQSWRQTGQHVLVCPQSPRYYPLFGVSHDAWMAHVTETLQAHTDREIRIRTKTDPRPIRYDLFNCWAAVVFSSSAALDALIAGVPVFVTADFAAAYRMGSHDLTTIERPYYPRDREAFLHVLADHQWTLDEMKRGEAWESLTRVH